MRYCKYAFALKGIKVVCGKKCPLFSKCPRLILEDAMDVGVEKATKALIEIKEK